jgi:hypothetical protein
MAMVASAAPVGQPARAVKAATAAAAEQVVPAEQ